MRQDKKIWVADDDESIRWVLEKGLTEAGFIVSTFEDGNEVMNKLDVESSQYCFDRYAYAGKRWYGFIGYV